MSRETLVPVDEIGLVMVWYLSKILISYGSRTHRSDVDKYHREARERRGPLEITVISGWRVPSRDASFGVGLFLECEEFVFVTIFVRDLVTFGKERDIHVIMFEVLVDFIETAHGATFLVM